MREIVIEKAARVGAAFPRMAVSESLIDLDDSMPSNPSSSVVYFKRCCFVGCWRCGGSMLLDARTGEPVTLGYWPGRPGSVDMPLTNDVEAARDAVLNPPATAEDVIEALDWLAGLSGTKRAPLWRVLSDAERNVLLGCTDELDAAAVDNLISLGLVRRYNGSCQITNAGRDCLGEAGL
jgi:hypothetical protein